MIPKCREIRPACSLYQKWKTHCNFSFWKCHTNVIQMLQYFTCDQFHQILCAKSFQTLAHKIRCSISPTKFKAKICSEFAKFVCHKKLLVLFPQANVGEIDPCIEINYPNQKTMNLCHVTILNNSPKTFWTAKIGC